MFKNAYFLELVWPYIQDFGKKLPILWSPPNIHKNEHFWFQRNMFKNNRIHKHEALVKCYKSTVPSTSGYYWKAFFFSEYKKITETKEINTFGYKVKLTPTFMYFTRIGVFQDRFSHVVHQEFVPQGN